ncbi:MAG TPA: hypothetical protein VFZ21_03785 [Gemmatimonadaceae bacterium]|jgi:hypothetical protein|nr:hypothetical protein [Gemmatimonadaceae bacterium]
MSIALRWRDALVVLALLPVAPDIVRQPTRPGTEQDDAYLTSLKANVVRVIAKEGMGFGFVTAIGDRTLLIATAEHTLSGGDAEPMVCFLGMSEPCPTGSVIYVDDPVPGRPDLDLALIEAPYPEGLVWRPDAMPPAPAPNDAAWFIGRDQDWFIPGTPGRIVALGDTGTVTYADLPLAEGVSGAPIVTSGGILAMHVNSDGSGAHARGVALGEIRSRVADRRQWHWLLVPRRECLGDDANRRALGGRTVVVHFDWTRPGNALAAMATLHCLGARTIPAPVWTTAGWTGDGITYRSGDLRTARALQTVLAPQGRLEARLGTPTRDAEVWIR